METDHAAQTGGEPESTNEELTPAQLAAIEAAKAAKKARKAQRKAQEQAERARLLAEEYARLAEHDAGPVSAVNAPDSVAEDEPAAAEGTVAAEAEPAADESPAEEERSARSRLPLVTAAVALGVCLAFAVAALIVFVTTGSSGNADAAARDNVARLAAQDIKVLNTMDYRHVDRDLRRWAGASTGSLYKQVTKATAFEKQQIQNAQRIATAEVKYQAITALDLADGSASVIASVDVTVKSTNGQSALKRERLLAEMTRVGSTWKVSSLSDVPVSSP